MSFLKETFKTTTGTVLVAGLAGSLLGAPVGDVAITAAAAGGVAGVAHTAGVPSEDLEIRDVLISLAPTVVSTIAAGLTLGWPVAFVGLLTGPLASLLHVTLKGKAPYADPEPGH